MPLKPCTDALGAPTSTRRKRELNSQIAGTFNLIPKINILKKSILFTTLMK